MSKIKDVHLVHVTLGDYDWEDTETTIVYSEEELAQYETEEFIKEKEKLGGVAYCRVDVRRNVTDEELRDELTLNEYLEIYPELKVVIDNYFKQ